MKPILSLRPFFPMFCICWIALAVIPNASTGGNIRQTKVKGKIHSVNLSRGVITLKFGKEAKPTHTEEFSLSAEDIPVDTDSEEKVKLSDLKPDQNVELRLSGVGDVVSIRAFAHRSFGFLKAVDVPGNAIILMGDDDRPVKKLKLAESCRIKVFGEESELKDVKPVMNVHMVFSLDKKSIYSLSAFYRSSNRDGRGVAIFSVDPATHSVQVLAGGHGNYRLKSYRVAKDFRFYGPKGYKINSLEDLPTAGTIKELVTSPDVKFRLTKENLVVAMFGRPAFLRGKVHAVDAVSRTLELDSGDILKVAADATIRPDRDVIELKDLSVGSEIGLRMSMDGQQVTFIGRPDDD